MKLRRLNLPPIIYLLIWSVVFSLLCFVWYKAVTKEETEVPNVSIVVEDEPFKGNNIYTYIELIQMPAETVFENIRVLITNKKNNSIFYDWDDYEEVKSQIEAEGYRGRIIYQEAAEGEEGFVIINEVPLEEYLYGVVPSEMPASYPMEALKAQAICARTYAVIHMMNPAYPTYNAHVNDTTSFQVYHNIEEQERTNLAVDETAGMLLYEANGQELVETYYYSTSCGLSCEASTNAEFKEYISNTYSSDFEVDESWYRWNCKVSNLDKDEVLKRMRTRYKANHNNVLTMTGKDSYESLPVRELETIEDLFISKRGDGGVGEELIISSAKNTYKIVGEYNIRYVLNDPDGEITRQDGNTVNMATLLPSAFISLEVIEKNKEVVGYHIIGGGYGHGKGMSQNGAKGMANQGYTTNEILEYFYPESKILNNF